MQPPQIDLIPSRPAVNADAPTALDVLVRISPPTADAPLARPAINLGIALDRSGSMAEGRKMAHAREAAIFAVEQLLPTDRVSVTIFDDAVETIVPSTPAADKARIIRRLGDVQPGGTTALHAGWAEGGAQVASHLNSEGLNRVLLLSDGLANVGLSDPKAIAADVRSLTARGVSTTTMGVGDQYNEDLLEAMANAGDGNYYYIQTPRQLADIFQTELRGLMATVGRTVSLGLEPQNDATVADVLNDFDKAPTGRLMLPNLVVGMPVEVVLRLDIPPTGRVTEVCRFRLAWNAPGTSERQTVRKTLILPAVSASEWNAMPIDPVVHERSALLVSARLKRKAAEHMDRHDFVGTQRFLDEARVCTAAAPASPTVMQELAMLAELKEQVGQGQFQKASKGAKFQGWLRRKSRPSS
jgi:Ca-activated chloride channel family protein